MHALQAAVSSSSQGPAVQGSVGDALSAAPNTNLCQDEIDGQVCVDVCMPGCPCVRLYLHVPLPMSCLIKYTCSSIVIRCTAAVAVCLQAAMVYYLEKTRALVPVALDRCFPLHTTQV